MLEKLPKIKDDVKIAPNRHPVEVKITLRDSCPFALLLKSTFINKFKKNNCL